MEQTNKTIAGKIRCVIYARVSTNKGEQNIQQQIDYLKDYAKRESIEVLKVFKDEVSGKVSNRRGYIRLIEYLTLNKDVIILVQDTNRLSRDYYDGVKLEKFLITNKINIISLSEIVDLNTPNGRLMFRIKNALNSQYVEDLAVKRVIGIERAKKQGKYLGRKKGALGKKK